MTSSAEELAALRDSVRGVLASRGTEADVRAAMETPSGYDPSLWQQLADLGIAGLVVPAEYGGSGAGPVELEAVAEEAGAALLCSPLLGSSVLAAALLAESGDRAAQAALLPAIAAGTGIVAAAITGPAGTWTADGVEVTAAEAGAAGRWTASPTTSSAARTRARCWSPRASPPASPGSSSRRRTRRSPGCRRSITRCGWPGCGCPRRPPRCWASAAPAGSRPSGR